MVNKKIKGYNFNVAGQLGYHNYGNCTTKTPRQEDVNTLLLLHKASYLAFGDEEILDVARTYSAKALKELMPSMLPHLREAVAHLYYNGILKLYLVHPVKRPLLRVFNHCVPKIMHTRIHLY